MNLLNSVSFLGLDVGPASVMVGNLVQGNRLASAQGRDLGLLDEDDISRRVSYLFPELNDIPFFNFFCSAPSVHCRNPEVESFDHGKPRDFGALECERSSCHFVDLFSVA